MNDSPDRIAADILVAALESQYNSLQIRGVGSDERAAAIAAAFKIIYAAVSAPRS